MCVCSYVRVLVTGNQNDGYSNENTFPVPLRVFQDHINHFYRFCKKWRKLTFRTFLVSFRPAENNDVIVILSQKTYGSLI